MIKVLICDGGGTLLLPNPSPEVGEFLKSIETLGITLAVASNSTRTSVVNRFLAAGINVPKIIVTPQDTGEKKPSPKFVDEIIRRAGVARTEVAYLGDDDRTDIFCAINSRVLPFSAHYSNDAKPREYGIPVYQPKSLSDYLQTFGKQPPPLFGWTYNSGAIDARALIYSQGDLLQTLISVLKNQQDVRIGSKSVSVRTLLFHYLIIQCYMSGLVSQMDYVTVYPGHLLGSTNLLLEEFSQYMQKSFKTLYLPHLIVRHTNAQQSRMAGSGRNIFEQFKTIHINPQYQEKIHGKNLLVLDDYTTSGFSFETARQMLLQAGVGRVTTIAIAKWRNEYYESEVDTAWNAYAPFPLKEENISKVRYSGIPHPPADRFFNDVIWRVYSS